MTDQQINDRLATEVMGWRPYECANGEIVYEFGSRHTSTHCQISTRRQWRPLTNPAQAIECRDALLTSRPELECTVTTSKGHQANVEFEDTENLSLWWAIDDIEPRAICLAILKVLDAEKEAA